MLVAEDLRDILTDEGAEDIITAPSLSQVTAGAARVVFIAGARGKALATDQLRHWIDQATPVVFLDDICPEGPANVHALAEPFRTQDVTDLLRRLHIF